MRIRVRAAVAAALAAVSVAGIAAAADPAIMPLDEAARAFGARDAVQQMSISPDGKKIAYIGAGEGTLTVLFVGDLAAGAVTPAIFTDGKPMNLQSCGWSANDRLVCTEYGIDTVGGTKLSYTRLLAVDADGRNQISLANSSEAASNFSFSQFSGAVVDWLDGQNGSLLIARSHAPETTTGTLMAKTAEGLGVDLVDTRTDRGKTVERARGNASEFISDGQGHIRMIGVAEVLRTQVTGTTTYMYRKAGGGGWLPFSSVDKDENGLNPIAVDPTIDAAYAVQFRNGRKALYRVALDGSMKTDLVLDNPQVDVDSVDVVGRNGRVIGATYLSDRAHTVFFDPAYGALAAQLGRALPKTPLVSFDDASADETMLVLRAGSDVDPGRFYVFNKTSHALNPVMSIRPELEGRQLAAMKPVTFTAPDGTTIPAYLTLPPGSSSAKNLPAIVMPHGGPQSRDEWGFDFLVQFFAARGYAVLQPEFRGSAGFGRDWLVGNGFKGWRLAIGDVDAAGHWLVSQGIADPAKLAIFGWSYGGYAALQANVLEPDLFKAAVAVAPVTDLAMLRKEAEQFTSRDLVKDFVGSGSLLEEASPARHAGAFKAPVLMFHGTRDVNVGFAESVAMNDALHAAGKASELVRYDGLDHQLADSKVRTDMLTRIDRFLRTSMKM